MTWDIQVAQNAFPQEPASLTVTERLRIHQRKMKEAWEDALFDAWPEPDPFREFGLPGERPIWWSDPYYQDA